MARSYESPRRVVVTGVGIVCPLGIGFDVFAANLLAGKSSITQLESTPFSGSPHNVGAEIKDFNDTTAKNEYLKKQRKSIKVMCREIQFGVASASLAIENSGLDMGAVNHDRFGVDFGANLMFSPPAVLQDACWTCVSPDDPTFSFRYDEWGGKGLRSLEPLWLLRYLPNMPACHIGIYADARGPSNSITLNEASGNLAVAEASHVIQRDLADIMIAGTTGTKIHSVKSMHAASVGPFWPITAAIRLRPGRDRSRNRARGKSLPKAPARSSWKRSRTPKPAAPRSWAACSDRAPRARSIATATSA